MDAVLALSIFESFDKPAVAARRTGSWSDFAGSLREPLAASTPKKALPLWSLADFRDGYRSEQSVQAITALTLDIDEAPIPDAQGLVHALFGLRAVVYSSSSATAQQPRWRASIALSRAVTAAEYRRVAGAVTRVLPFAVGAASHDPARQWYCAREGADGHFEWMSLEGEPLDVDSLLALVPELVAPASAVRVVASSPVGVDRRAAAVQLLGSAWAGVGGRHAAQLALAGALCRDGWAEPDAVEVLVDVCRLAGDEDRPKRVMTVADTYRRATAGTPFTGWTGLEKYVDPAIVAAARGLLDRGADARREIEAELSTAPADPAPVAVLRTPDVPAHFSTKIRCGGDWDQPYVRPTYLLEGLIPRSTVCTFFAEGGSVKSWSAFALAISVATGSPWLGVYPVVTGRVLILDFEDGWHEFLRRKKILTQHLPSLDLSGLEYLYAGPNLVDPELWRYLGTQDYTLIVVDALGSGMPGDVDENDNVEFVQGLKMAGRFVEASEPPCNVLVVHHANKSGGMRGASAIRDQNDVVFAFEPVSETETTKRMRMTCNKAGPQVKPRPVNVELSDAGLTTFEDETQRAPATAGEKGNPQAAARLAIEVRGSISGAAELATILGCREAAARSVLRLLEEGGHVIKGRDRRMYWADEAAQRKRVLAHVRERGPRIKGIPELQKWAAAARTTIEDMIAEHILGRTSTTDLGSFFVL